MKEKLESGLISLVAYMVIGAAIMVGIRAAEWLIPQPETRVIICTYDDMGETECKAAADLMRAKLVRKGVGV